MSIWQRLANGLNGAFRALDQQRSPDFAPPLPKTGRFNVEVVGESHYTPAFRALLGPAAFARAVVDGVAVLRTLDNHPHDANAVGVYWGGRQVGHLSREDAIKYRAYLRQSNLTHRRAMSAQAQMYAGDERGLFSVRLDLPL